MMSEKPDIQPLDWVQFYDNGKLVLSVVLHVRYRESFPQGWEILTADGTRDADTIVETRRGR